MRQIVSPARDKLPLSGYHSKIEARRAHTPLVVLYCAHRPVVPVGRPRNSYVKCVSIPFRAYRIRFVIEYRISRKVITRTCSWGRRGGSRLYSCDATLDLYRPFFFSFFFFTTVINYSGYSKLNNSGLF